MNKLLKTYIIYKIGYSIGNNDARLRLNENVSDNQEIKKHLSKYNIKQRKQRYRNYMFEKTLKKILLSPFYKVNYQKKYS